MIMTQGLGRPGQPLPSRGLGGDFVNSLLTTHQGIEYWDRMYQTPQDSTPPPQAQCTCCLLPRAFAHTVLSSEENFSNPLMFWATPLSPKTLFLLFFCFNFLPKDLGCLLCVLKSPQDPSYVPIPSYAQALLLQ